MVMMLLHQAWERLEKAEHERELALRMELIRQEKLEQLARRFDRKAAMRETWLSENQRLVSQVGRPNSGLQVFPRKHQQPTENRARSRERTVPSCFSLGQLWFRPPGR